MKSSYFLTLTALGKDRGQFVGIQECLGEGRAIQLRRGVLVMVQQGVFHNEDLKTLLKQFALVRFDTDKDDLVDAALPQLQDKIIALRTPDFMGTDSDGLAVFE